MSKLFACIYRVLSANDLDSSTGSASHTRPRHHEVPERPDYNNSSWGQMLKDERLNDASSKEAKLFRRRFRLPYTMFRYVVSECRREHLFPESERDTDIAGRRSIPLELKILGVLRIIGRNWCLDDVCEASLISERTMSRFFHEFCQVFVRHFWNRYVKTPNGDDLDEMLSVYAKLGLPGCVGSIDCVHLKWDKCPVWLSNECKGKEGYPSLVFEVCVDHMRRVRASTNSFYGSLNDKTIIKYDDYIQAVRKGQKWGDVVFEVFDAHGNTKEETGVWFICDNGYHRWSCLMSPFAYCSSEEKIRWSEWVESVRKDIECFFGIVKARFRLLRDGIQYHNADEITNIFHVCCILHNMLLEFDGLDFFCEEQWERLNPQHKAQRDEEDYDEAGEPLDVEFLSSTILPEWRGFIHNVVQIEEDRCYHEKREMLVTHFNKAYRMGQVSWPKRFSEFNKFVYGDGRNLDM